MSFFYTNIKSSISYSKQVENWLSGKKNKWKISTKHQETLTADSADQGWNFRKGRKHNTNQYIPLEMSSLNIKFEKVVWYCGYLGKKVLCHGDERH